MMRLLVGSLMLMVAGVALATEPLSGYAFLDESTRAMQDDDFENPGMVAVDRGAELFHEHRDGEEYSCSSCHDDDGAGLDVAQIARHPVFNANLGGLVTLQARVSGKRSIWISQQ